MAKTVEPVELPDQTTSGVYTSNEHLTHEELRLKLALLERENAALRTGRFKRGDRVRIELEGEFDEQYQDGRCRVSILPRVGGEFLMVLPHRLLRVD